MRYSKRLLIMSLSVLLFPWGQAMSHTESVQGIHVGGGGEISIEPDIARTTLQVTRQGRDPAALKREMDTVTASVLELTDSLKIKRKDVTAAMVQISPNRVYENNRQRIDGVTATRTISITLRNLDNIGELMNRALEMGINDIGGMQLDSSERIKHEGKALDLAIADAKAQAARVAKGFGVRLQGVVDVQVVGGHRVQPQAMGRMASAAVDSGDSFSPGEIIIRRDIQATFAIGGE